MKKLITALLTTALLITNSVHAGMLEDADKPIKGVSLD